LRWGCGLIEIWHSSRGVPRPWRLHSWCGSVWRVCPHDGFSTVPRPSGSLLEHFADSAVKDGGASTTLTSSREMSTTFLQGLVEHSRSKLSGPHLRGTSWMATLTINTRVGLFASAEATGDSSLHCYVVTAGSTRSHHCLWSGVRVGQRLTLRQMSRVCWLSQDHCFVEPSHRFRGQPRPEPTET